MDKDLSEDEKTKLKEILKKKDPNITDEQLVEKLKELSQDPDRAHNLLNTSQPSDNDDTLTVSDQALEETIENENWKEDVREAIKKANDKLKYNFAEDEEDTEHLTFKEGENTISFSSPNDAYVEGEQIAFDELVVAAKKMGKTSIKFGEFEKHPEYKAMLYLACLKHGMKMSNAPDLSDFKDNPQAQEALKGIIKHQYTDAAKKLDKAKKAFYTAVTENPTKEENTNLKAAFDTLKEEKKKSPQDPDRISELETQIKEHPLGKDLAEAVENKTSIIKQGIEYDVLNKKGYENYISPTTDNSSQTTDKAESSMSFSRNISQMIIQNAIKSK